MGRRFVDGSVIRARMQAKDDRYSAEARRAAEKRATQPPVAQPPAFVRRWTAVATGTAGGKTTVTITGLNVYRAEADYAAANPGVRVVLATHEIID